MVTCFCGMVHDLGRRGFLGALMAMAVEGQGPAPASAGPADPALIDDLVAANRILYDQGVVDGFGHVSARHNKDPNRYLLARSMAPALVTVDDIMEYDLDSTPVDQRGRAVYLERFIHGEIYKLRPDVMAIVHSHSPAVLPYANTKVELRPMNHIAGFLGGGVPVFEIRDVAGPASNMLISNGTLGHALATTLGAHPVALMRGHGSVAAAQSVRHVTFRAIYTEVNARMESEALRLGDPMFLNEGEAAAAMKTNDGLVDRPWDLWKRRAMGK
ncbi:MAG TPA: class II aldolase/adducin family protein [Acetobacteraceae bacterium]|jgi:HCOMODA/2-hydroxy-3-carboxy-muconic semialdehyde decarboxylase|nr:class II aldolase/adducin family protein [Acetobacteraceae bacterium]